jgi:hypothetical protein
MWEFGGQLVAKKVARGATDKSDLATFCYVALGLAVKSAGFA